MGYEDDWAEITGDPDWEKMSPKQRNDVARYFARKVVRPQAGAGSPALKGFLEKNLATNQGNPAPRAVHKATGFFDAAGRSFADEAANNTLTGNAARFALHGGKEFETGDLVDATTPMAKAGAYLGRVAGQIADPTNLIPISKGAQIGKAAVGAGSLKAAVQATLQAGKSGAVMAGGMGATNVALQRSNEGLPFDAGEVAMGGVKSAVAGGLLAGSAAAAKVAPSGRFNPNLPNPFRRAAPPAPAPAPAPVRALPPAPEEAARLAEMRASGMTPAQIIAEQRSRAVAKRPPSTPAGPIAGQPAPVHPGLPPGEAFMTHQPNPGTIGKPTGLQPVGARDAAFTQQAGPRPAPNAIPMGPVPEAPRAPSVAGLLPETSTVNVPPGGFQPPGPDALTAQFGSQPAPAPPGIAGYLPERSNVNVPPNGFRDPNRAMAGQHGGEHAPANPMTSEAIAAAQQQLLGKLEARHARLSKAETKAKTAKEKTAAAALRDQVERQIEEIVVKKQAAPEPPEPPAMHHGGEPPPPPPDPGNPYLRASRDNLETVRAAARQGVVAAQEALPVLEAKYASDPNPASVPAPAAGGFFSKAGELLRGEQAEATVEGAIVTPLAPIAAGLGAARQAVGAVADAGLSAAEAVAGPARNLERSLVDGPLEAVVNNAPGVKQIAGIPNAAKNLVKSGFDALSDVVPFSFVSDHGLPAGYADVKDAVATSTRRDMAGLDRKADELAGLDDVAQAKLYQEATTPGAKSPEAAAVGDLTTPISRELRDVGALTDRQQGAWDGNYLPRTYTSRPDSAIGAIIRKGAGFLKGSKHRGKKETMDAATWERVSRRWEHVGDGPNGRAIIRDADAGTTAMVPARKLGSFVGQWRELGRTKDGKVTAWRDWTPNEREAMGEVKNVSVALRKMAVQARRDLHNGRLLREVSQNPEWARPVAGGPVPEGWVHLSNEQTGTGVARWGLLADHYVHPAIARDLHSAMVMQPWLSQVSKFTGTTLWKKAKTIWNPASHLNNFMVNVPTLELAGGSVWDLPGAARLLKERGDDFKQMEDLGLFDDGWAASEFADAVGSGNWSNPLEAAMQVGMALDKKASGAYQAGDDVFRAALVLGRVREGVPMEAAVKQARSDFYSGSKVNSDFARVGSATVLPFIKPWLYAADKMPELVARNPAKAIKLLLYYQGANALFAGMSGDTPEKKAGREAMLPDYQKGPGKVLWPPIKDSNGQPLMLDVQNWNPFNFLDTTERTAMPEYEIPGVTEATGIKAGYPQGLTPGGPIGTVFALAGNYDPFYQRPLRTDTGNDTAAFLAREMGPPALTTGLGKLKAAVDGLNDPSGRRVDARTAAANLGGLKLQPFDVDERYGAMERRYSAQAHEIEGKGRTVQAQLQRGSISEAQADAEMARLQGLYDTLMAEAERHLAVARQALPAPAPAGASR